MFKDRVELRKLTEGDLCPKCKAKLELVRVGFQIWLQCSKKPIAHSRLATANEKARLNAKKL